MRAIALVVGVLGLASFGCGQDPVGRTATPIRINEVNPSNTAYQDANGDTGDWVELYNTSANDFDLEGYYLSDSVNVRFKGLFATGTAVPAHGFLLVWADAKTEQSAPQEPHMSFKLSAEGEGVWLSNPQGYIVDSVEFRRIRSDAAVVDASFARFPDATGQFHWCSVATPNSLNGSACMGEILF